jgi:hypothetical protein
MTAVRAIACGLLVLAGGVGCSSASIDGIPQPLLGPVTVISGGNVCVGGPAASGDCFIAPAAKLRGLHFNECVLVRWKSAREAGAAPDILISIKPVGGTPPDC